jgi:hypothetical protein
MKRPTFLEGVGVALVACVVGGTLYAILPYLFGWDSPLRALIAGLGFAYIVYLLNRSHARVGKVTVASFWLAGAVALWLVHPPFTVYLLLHVGAVWFVRCLYFYRGLIPAAIDLALTGFGLAAALWAAIETGSLLVVLWSFFLCQALFTEIPRNLRPKRRQAAADAPFERAHRAGEAALRALSSSH